MPPIEIVVDDDETASEPESADERSRLSEAAKLPPTPPTSSTVTTASRTNLGKRKAEDVPLVERVVWTDDSEEEELERARSKRQSTAAAAKGKGKGRGKARGGRRGGGGSGSVGSRRSSRRPEDLIAGVKSVGEDSEPEDYAAASMPEYLCDRRRDFDKQREKLREAGLRLPPDYTDIYFSDDDYEDEDADLGGGGGGGRRRPERRPKFHASVKPSRASVDVELEYSAGLIPACIARYLRDYQIAGVKFLHQLFVYQKGGILGDDMGLGKTVQVAVFLTVAFGKSGDSRDKKRLRKMRRAGDGRWYPRVLIVCPGTLLENWKKELSRWGWWNIEVFHGAGREEVLKTARSGHLEVMLTTYQTYKNQKDQVNAVEWDAVVADECHCLKDRRSETTKAMNEVNALCRIGLTGTAIQNRYEELWTLLNWTNPGRFGTFAEWRRTISVPLAMGQSHDATLQQLSVARSTAKKLVNNLLPEFFLRRMKTLIADQLPKKSDKVVFCPMTDFQRTAYETFLASEQVELIRQAGEPCTCGSGRKKGWCCHQKLSDGRPWHALVFPSITALQKLACHIILLIPAAGDSALLTKERRENALATLRASLPDCWEELYRNRDALINLANPEFCGKWKILRKLLKFWYENGDKVLVFSHNVRLLRILQLLLHNASAGYNISYLDGSLRYEERQQVVDDFNSDPAQFVFLISTRAGGVGLNITSANKVVIFDPHWNPSHDLQAQDRAYRIGQERDVDVFRLISAGTIEEIKYARQIYKQQQANIGYNASTERRYFKGVQQDKDRKGEIFGLQNLFSFHGDHVVLRDIVNKTNIAEAKAGVLLADVDLEQVIKDDVEEGGGGGGGDEEDGHGGGGARVKQEEEDDAGLSQLAKLLTTDESEKAAESKKKNKAKRAPRSDAIQAILSSAGVEYTHENSEVIGSSKVEAQLSRRAEMAAASVMAGGGDDVLFPDSQANKIKEVDSDNDDPDSDDPDEDGGGWVYERVGDGGGGEGNETKRKRFRFRYNPPADVMRRQFCTMAKEFGFESATEFALVVESWTQEQRRNCLDAFYRQREAALQLTRDDEGSGNRNERGGVKKEEIKEEEGKLKMEDVKDEDGDVKMKVESKKEEEDEDQKVKEEVKVKKQEVEVKLEVKDEEDVILIPDDDGSVVDMKAEDADGDVRLVDVKQEPRTQETNVRRVSSIFIVDDDDDDEL